MSVCSRSGVYWIRTVGKSSRLVCLGSASTARTETVLEINRNIRTKTYVKMGSIGQTYRRQYVQSQQSGMVPLKELHQLQVQMVMGWSALLTREALAPLPYLWITVISNFRSWCGCV
jgi:hypothetical protein